MHAFGLNSMDQLLISDFTMTFSDNVIQVLVKCLNCENRVLKKVESFRKFNFLFYESN